MNLARLVVLGALVLAPSAVAQHAQEHGEAASAHSGEHGDSGGHANLNGWKWANFLILAGALGWVLAKHGGPFFQSRSEQIRKEIREAEARRSEADARSAEIDRRLANLDTEIESLRETARGQAAAEGERIRAASAAQIAAVQAQAEHEIAAAAKAARQELKGYSAHLAVSLARQRIGERMGPETQDGLVQSFAEGLRRARKT